MKQEQQWSARADYGYEVAHKITENWMEEEAPVDRSEIFFGARPADILADISHSAADIVADGCDGLEHDLLKDPAYKGKEARTALRTLVDTFGTKLQTAIERNFGKFEAYASRNIFSIADELELDPDGSTLRAQEAALDDEIRNKLVKLAGLRVLNKQLQIKKYLQGADLREFEQISSQLAATTKAAAKTAGVAELREKMAELREVIDRQTKQSKRTTYIA